MTNTKRGFTLIELLVVIAIIGILSSVVLASLNSARQKARDGARISDASQIRLALEDYFDNNNRYPAVAGFVDGFSSMLPVLPTESSPGRQAYEYNTDTNGTIYCFGVDLEGTNIPNNNAANCLSGGTSAAALSGSADYAIMP